MVIHLKKKTFGFEIWFPLWRLKSAFLSSGGQRNSIISNKRTSPPTGSRAVGGKEIPEQSSAASLSLAHKEARSLIRETLIRKN